MTFIGESTHQKMHELDQNDRKGSFRKQNQSGDMTMRKSSSSHQNLHELDENDRKCSFRKRAPSGDTTMRRNSLKSSPRPKRPSSFNGRSKEIADSMKLLREKSELSKTQSCGESAEAANSKTEVSRRRKINSCIEGRTTNEGLQTSSVKVEIPEITVSMNEEEDIFDEDLGINKDVG